MGFKKQGVDQQTTLVSLLLQYSPKQFNTQKFTNISGIPTETSS